MLQRLPPEQQRAMDKSACFFPQFSHERPHRLVVRTSRRGRDNPGSTPGVVMQVRRTAEIHGTDRMPDTPASMSGVGHAYAFQTGAQSARAAARAHTTSISCPTRSGGLRHSGVPGHQSLFYD